MENLQNAFRAYRYHGCIGLLNGLNYVLRLFLNDGKTYSSAVVEAIIFGEHQERMKFGHHWAVDYEQMKKDGSLALQDVLDSVRKDRPASFEDLYALVSRHTRGVNGIGVLTVYDIALRIGFLQQELLLPQDKVYIQAGALTGIQNLTENPEWAALFPADIVWKEGGVYDMALFRKPFEGMGDMCESMFIEDFLCVYDNLLGTPDQTDIRKLQGCTFPKVVKLFQ